MASKYLICFDLHWWFYGDKIDGDMPISILQTTFQSHLSLSIIQLLNLEVLTKPSNTTPHDNQKYKIWAIEKQLLSYPPNFQKCWHLNSRPEPPQIYLPICFWMFQGCARTHDDLKVAIYAWPLTFCIDHFFYPPSGLVSPGQIKSTKLCVSR